MRTRHGARLNAVPVGGVLSSTDQCLPAFDRPKFFQPILAVAQCPPIVVEGAQAAGARHRDIETKSGLGESEAVVAASEGEKEIVQGPKPGRDRQAMLIAVS